MAFPLDPRVTRYPADRVARYLDTGAWSDKPLAERFRAVARRFAGRPALIDRLGTVTYAELDLRSDLVAAGLLQVGVRPGDPVLFQVANSIAGVEAWYGVIKAGAIPVATLQNHRAHEIGRISETVGATAHIVDDATPERFDMVAFATDQANRSSTLTKIFTVRSERTSRTGIPAIESLGSSIDPAEARGVVDGIQRDLTPEHAVVHQLSGGTTGLPKVIPRLHGEYWNNALAWATALDRDDRSVTCHPAPFVHNAGITCGLHSTHSVGGCLVLPPPQKEIALRMMREHHVDDVLFIHGMFDWIMSNEFVDAATHLRTVILAGGKAPIEVFERAEKNAAFVGHTFGMGEGMFALTPPSAPRDLRATTAGLPMTPDDEIRILDPASEQELPVGEVGELACRGSYTIPGYFDAPEHNARVFTSDGFYRSGDLAKIRVHGGRPFLSIEGRIKDLIDRGGEKVNADEVEHLLREHPDIADAAVVGMPDARLGEKVCAYVVSGGATVDVSHLRSHLERLGVAKYKWPERVETLDALPRTHVGKIDKKRLRADIAAKISR